MPIVTRKWLKRLLVVGAVGVTLWLLAAYVAAHKLTRRARPMQPEPVPSIGWGTLQPVRLTTADGEELGAWFVDGRPNRPAVVLLHGNGGTRTASLDQAELLAAAGYAVLMPTLRAHGDSTGGVNDFGYSARHDLIAAVGWLEANQAGRPVLVWGRSLGAAASLFASQELGGRVRGYILECPYRDLRTAVRNRTRHYLPPGVDFIAYSGLSAVSPLVLPDADRISPLEAAAGIPHDVPVLILAGGADRRARPEEAREIHARLGPRATLIVFDTAGHLDLIHIDPERYRTTALGFLEGCR